MDNITEENTIETTPQPETNRLEEIISIINDMMGAQDYKKLADELIRTAPLIKAANAYRAVFFQSFLFSINEGYGLSSAIRLLKELVEELGLYRRQFVPQEGMTQEQLEQLEVNSVIEVKLERPEHLADSEPLEKVLYSMEEVQPFPKVICFDISNWTFYVNDSRFKSFLHQLSNFKIDCLFIFRVPFLADDVLENINKAINDMIFVRTVKFIPLSNKELLVCTRSILERYNLSLTEYAEKSFYRIIAEEKSDGKFYGLRTIDKIVNKIIYYKLLQMADRQSMDNFISGQDLDAIFRQKSSSEYQGLAQLDEMIGMDGVKKQIADILEMVDTQKQLIQSGKGIRRRGINLLFRGNPGTGKSTVARIIGNVLREKEILELGNVIEVQAQSLCGRYAGETIPKVSGICRDAYGSVLFIEDPLSLYKGRGNSEYGLEVVETLSAEMENREDALCVIMAGNDEDLTLFMENNPELKEKFNYEILFPDFSKTDLRRLFFKMIDDNVRYDMKFVTAIDEFFNSISEQQFKSKNFSNARMVKNLYELVWARALVRSQQDDAAEVVFLAEDVSKAMSEKKFKELLQKGSGKNIGFSL